MKIKSIICALLCSATLLSLASCKDGDSIKPKSRSFYEYFDTVGSFYDYSGSNKVEFRALADRVEAELIEYHRLYDIYEEYDGIVNLATLNRLAGTGAVKVDKKIIDMLLYAKEMYALTDGKVNVAMGSVLSIWHDYREEGKEIPPTELLMAAAKHTDINSLVIDEEQLTVEILDPELSLDVGAIAKGYAVEEIAKALESEGKSSLVLDVGGNLRAIGTKKDGSGWITGIRNPDISSLQTYVYRLELKNAAVVTSGSYERFYTVGGVRYHHIINGDSLMPANYYTSVSVRSRSSALSDALSTAIFNMGYEEARAFVDDNPDVFVILVMPSGEVITLGEQ